MKEAATWTLIIPSYKSGYGLRILLMIFLLNVNVPMCILNIELSLK